MSAVVPAGSPAPPRGTLAPWVWSYRTCNNESAAALSIQIANEEGPNDRFPANANYNLEFCGLEFVGPERRPLDFRSFQIDIDWVGQNRGGGGDFPTVLPGRHVQFVLSISLSNLERYAEYANRARPFVVDGVTVVPAAYRAFLLNPGYLVIRSSGGRRMIALPTLNGILDSATVAEQQRLLQCRLGNGNRQIWGSSFGRRDLPFRKFGPEPYVLIDKLLEASQRPQLATLLLPQRQSLPQVSLMRRSVMAVLGRGSPNAAAFAGLPPADFNNNAAPMAAPIGLARLPRRP